MGHTLKTTMKRAAMTKTEKPQIDTSWINGPDIRWRPQPAQSEQNSAIMVFEA